MKKIPGFVKLFVFLLALAGIICLTVCAGAEGSGWGLRTKIPVPARKRIIVTEGVPGRRALLSNWREDTYAVTSQEVTWTLTQTESALGNGKFMYVIGALDETHPDRPDGTKISDTLYEGRAIAATSFSYTFYETGEYILFIYPCKTVGGKDLPDEDQVIISCVHVSKGSGANRLENAVQALVPDLTGTDDFETALNINDYLCNRVTYDGTYTYYSAADAILYGRGVCNSYARAFEIIAKACGLEAMRAVGTGHGGDHAWNAVKMDGNWYQVDVTWNDGEDPHYLYFGLTDSLIGINHLLENYAQGRSCTCNHMEDNYFIHTGKWRTILARDSYEILQTQVNRGLGTVETSLGKTYMDENSGWYWTNPEIDFLYGHTLAWAYTETPWTRTIGTKSYTISGSFTYNETNKTLNGTFSVKIIVLPEGLKEIETEAFAGTDCEAVILPDSCLTVGAGAFMNCDKLVYVSCKEGTVFGEGAVDENVTIIRRE